MKKIVIFASMIIFTILFAGCYSDTEAFSPQSYTAQSAEVTAVKIDVRDRQVEVLRSEDGQIHLDYFESEKEYYDISVSEDKVLSMKAVTEKEWKDFIGGKASGDVRKITLRVPDAVLETLSIFTTNEDIFLTPLTLTGNASLSANGGNITFEKLAVEKEIALNVKNGNISGEISGHYDDYAISCAIKKGETNLPANKETGSKKLSVTANNGDVTIEIR